MSHGISFPATPDGDRSTTTTGRGIVADALRPVDPIGSRAAEQDTAWRTGYVDHLRRLVEAGLPTPEDWVTIARAGLASTYARMVVAGEGSDQPLSDVLDAPAARELKTVEVVGSGEREREFSLPYQGRRLRGTEVIDLAADWVARGIVEPSVAEALSAVVEHPEWLAAPGHSVAVLGAGAEMGPLRALLRWGVTVAAVDLPRPDVWRRVLENAEVGAGRLLVPAATGEGDLSARAGVDLLAEVPAVADWIVGHEGRPVIGNYLYADGGTHVRVSTAADALGRRVTAARPDAALAFLATPTDVFLAPRDAVAQSEAAYADRSAASKTLGQPLRWASRGRLLQRAYPPGADPGVADSLVPVQGPNYAIAKRIQRWRAAVARAEGQTVSFHVAPSTRTHSVVKNRALAAAFAGAHRFGVEVFEPATSNVLMAALLVHDLMGTPPTHAHPWQDEAYAAAHGGLWRTAYAPRSALGLAAVLGYSASRS